MTYLAPGIHRIPEDRYHADPCEEPSLSSTLAKKIIGQSPLHAWTESPRLNPNYEPVIKREFDIGRAAHQAILGAGAPTVEIPDDYLGAGGAVSTKRAKEFCEQAREGGSTPLKSDDIARIDQMKAKVVRCLRSRQINLMTVDSEVVAIARIDGTMCRAMIDNAPSDPSLPLYDFKTTTDAAPDAVMRSIMNYGYDIQASHYLDTWKRATGEDRGFRFIFQEKTAPFEVSIVELHPEALVMGRKKIARAREVWRKCVRSNYWPGYPEGVHQINPPAWFAERWLEQESAAADHKATTGQDILDSARRWQAPEDFQLAGE